MAIVKTPFAVCIFFISCTVSWGQSLAKNWSINHETNIGSGYDSNISGSREETVGDGFATASQSLDLSRKNSLTMLSFKGNVSKTQFFAESDSDFVVGGIEVDAAYPEETTDITFWRANASLNRVSQVNLDAGRRIQPTISAARMSGEWLFSPKSGITGSLSGRVTDRSRDGYNTTRALSLKTGFSHAWRAEQRWSTEYGLTFGDTDAGSGTDSVRHMVGLRGRGRLLPKLSGDAYVGFSRTEFSGDHEFTDSSPIASFDLNWAASPRFNAQIGIESDYDFTATGSAIVSTEATLRLLREFGNGLRFTTTIGRGYSDYKRESRIGDRSDRFWKLSGELEYSFTRRFFTRISGGVIDSDSSIHGYDINHGIVSIFSGWRY